MTSRKLPANRIAEFRKSRNFSQQQLADKIGSHWITVSKLERGVMRLSDEWRLKIAEALDVDQWDLVIGARVLPTIHVEGRIFEDGSIEGVDEGEVLAEIDTEYFTHPEYRWLEVGDNGLWPWFQAGDLICMLELYQTEVEEHLGRICVGWFHTEEESDVTIGVLERGRSEGSYSIQRLGLPPKTDIELKALSVVAMAVYDVGKSRPRRE